MSAQQYVQLCTFRIDGVQFALDARCMREVLRRQPITPVPLSARHVAGLINIRGQIVTAVNLASDLGLDPASPGAFHIVVIASGEPLSVLVDSVGAVLEVPRSALDPAPPSTPAELSRLVTGACRTEGGLVLLLDVEGHLS